MVWVLVWALDMEWEAITHLIILITGHVTPVIHIMVVEAITVAEVIMAGALFMTIPEMAIIPHIAGLLQQQEI